MISVISFQFQQNKSYPNRLYVGQLVLPAAFNSFFTSLKSFRAHLNFKFQITIHPSFEKETLGPFGLSLLLLKLKIKNWKLKTL